MCVCVCVCVCVCACGEVHCLRRTVLTTVTWMHTLLCSVAVWVVLDAHRCAVWRCGLCWMHTLLCSVAVWVVLDAHTVVQCGGVGCVVEIAIVGVVTCG